MKIKTFYVEQKMAEIVGNDVCVKILKNTYTVWYNKRTVCLDGKKGI